MVMLLVKMLSQEVAFLQRRQTVQSSRYIREDSTMANKICLKSKLDSPIKLHMNIRMCGCAGESSLLCTTPLSYVRLSPPYPIHKIERVTFVSVHTESCIITDTDIGNLPYCFEIVQSCLALWIRARVTEPPPSQPYHCLSGLTP